MDNQHKLITGYRDLTKEEVDRINEVKALAGTCQDTLDELIKTEGLDGRALSIAKTNIEQGFMWAIKAVAQPTKW